MQNKSITKVNKTAIICLIVFSIITIFRISKHIPWFDEAHAWTIAEQLSFVDMFNYVKNEGHFFIWQAILYPFAHSHIIPYPYPMQAISWIFCFLALVVMWWKAPFNNCVKALITFSFPFLGCFGVLARCYTIGIFLLFILASMFNKKTEYPKTYALLLILCANTSVMALIGATAFGILFLIDIFKNKLNKKDYIYIGIILTIGAVLILYQVFLVDHFSTIVENGHFYTTLIMFQNTYVYHNLLINLLMTAVFMVLVFRYTFIDKKSSFFILFTYLIMLILCFRFYGINFWHAYFFYIFLIITLWIHKDRDKDYIAKKVAISVFALISFILVYHYPEETNFSGVYKSEADKISRYIESDELLKHSTIIHNTGSVYEVIPYLHNKSYKIKNYCSIEDNTDYNLFYIFYGECVRGNIFGQAQKYPDIIKELAVGNVFAYTEKDKNPQVHNYGVIKADNYSLVIKKYKCFDKHCFWKIKVQ